MATRLLQGNSAGEFEIAAVTLLEYIEENTDGFDLVRDRLPVHRDLRDL